MTNSSDSRVLERLLEPVTASLNAEAAAKLVGLRADNELQDRIDVLAQKCTEGKLTSAERAEYERYVLVGDLLAILQAKARLLLRTSQRPS